MNTKTKLILLNCVQFACVVTMVILMFSLGGCASPKWQQANQLHGELLSKFTYVDQSKDDQVREWTGFEEQFHGDCDDYYIAVHNRFKALGWTTIGVYALHKETRVRHVIACTYSDSQRLICLDNESDLVRKWSQVEAHYHVIRHWLETR